MTTPRIAGRRPAFGAADGTAARNLRGSESATTERLLEMLRRRGESLGTAESITAGLVASTLAMVPGASDVLRGGIAAYAEDLKVDVLGVDAAVIARHGVYSAECAEAMALAALETLRVDWAVSTTGVAGPDAQQGHPAGEVYVAAAGASRPELARSRRVDLAGDRNDIRSGAALAALELLASMLAEHA